MLGIERGARRRRPRARAASGLGQRRRLLRDATPSRARTCATASGSSTATSSAASSRRDVVVEGTFRTAAAQHAAMEPHAMSRRAGTDERLELWTGTHTPFNVREDLAGVFGLPEEQVRVVCPPMGGSFGAKTFVHLEAVDAALARKAGRPVRVVLPARGGVGDEQPPSGVDPRTVSAPTRTARSSQSRSSRAIDTGAYADCGPGVAVKIGYSAVGPYRIPNVARRVPLRVHEPAARRRVPRVRRDAGGLGVRVGLMDMLAERLGIDPLELRLKNVLRDGDTFCTGETVHDVHFADCLERAAAARSAGTRERVARGCACFSRACRRRAGRRIAVEADDDGTYTLRCATAEMGQGVAAGAVARRGRAARRRRPRRCASRTRTPSLVPYDTRATSSRSTYMMSRRARGGRARAATGRHGAAFGEVRERGRARPGYRPGDRLLALAPGRRCRRGAASTRRPARSRWSGCTPPCTPVGSSIRREPSSRTRAR